MSTTILGIATASKVASAATAWVTFSMITLSRPASHRTLFRGSMTLSRRDWRRDSVLLLRLDSTAALFRLDSTSEIRQMTLR